MRITADTNVLVRAIVAGEPRKARLVQSALENADLVAFTPTTLCEFVRVLSRGKDIPPDDVAAAIRHRPDDFLTYPELRKCDV